MYWDGRPACREVLAGMCRLAPRDLKLYVEGSTALASPGGGSSALVGRLYNVPELRAALEKRGFRASGNSESEIIGQLAQDANTGFFSQLNGMFACAVIQPPRLLLARDRFGQRMMACAVLPYGIVFATDINAIALHPDVDLALDPVALDDLLGLDYIPAPKTIYRGVRKLKPGMALVVDGDYISAHLYWDITQVPQAAVDERTAIAHTAHLLREAVARCLPSTAPAGVLLSSGLDSNTVAALAVRHGPIKTFTAGFKNCWRDESANAARAATVHGADHHVVPVEYATCERLPDLLAHCGEPFADSSILPAYEVATAAAAQMPIVLSGDGGDALFAPLAMWRKDKHFAAHPAQAPRRVYTDAWRDHLAHAASREFLLAPDGAAAQRHYIQRWSFFDDSVMFKVSRISARTGLEIRAPFLDVPFVEWAAGLPADYAVRDGAQKWILREAAADLLPPFILDLPKRGFGAPILEWMPKLLDDYGGVLRDDAMRARGIFDPARLARLVEGYYAGKTNPHTLYPYLVFEMWRRATDDLLRQRSVF